MSGVPSKQTSVILFGLLVAFSSFAAPIRIRDTDETLELRLSPEVDTFRRLLLEKLKTKAAHLIPHFQIGCGSVRRGLMHSPKRSHDVDLFWDFHASGPTDFKGSPKDFLAKAGIDLDDLADRSSMDPFHVDLFIRHAAYRDPGEGYSGLFGIFVDRDHTLNSLFVDLELNEISGSPEGMRTLRDRVIRFQAFDRVERSETPLPIPGLEGATSAYTPRSLPLAIRFLEFFVEMEEATNPNRLTWDREVEAMKDFLPMYFETVPFQDLAHYEMDDRTARYLARIFDWPTINGTRLAARWILETRPIVAAIFDHMGLNLHAWEGLAFKSREARLLDFFRRHRRFQSRRSRSAQCFKKLLEVSGARDYTSHPVH